MDLMRKTDSHIRYPGGNDLLILLLRGFKNCKDRKVFKRECNRLKIIMQNCRDDLWADSGYRIRYMQSLIGQIKSDYTDLNSFLNIKNGGRDILPTDAVLGKISWIRQTLKMFDKLRMMEIEGVFSTEVEAIKRDIRDISESLDRY